MPKNVNNKRKTKRNKKRGRQVKKKYNSRRVSFRNIKSTNIRTKSLKKKGGTFPPQAFGLPKDSNISKKDLDDYESTCDDLAPRPGLPENPWAINYLDDREQRIRCYTYYLYSFSFYQHMKKSFSPELRALYSTYQQLYNEDTNQNKDVIDAKAKYLESCRAIKQSKIKIGMATKNWLYRWNKETDSDDTILSVASRNYKLILNKTLKRLETDKDKNSEQIKKIRGILKKKNPLKDDRATTLAKAKANKEDAIFNDRLTNSGLLMEYSYNMTMAMANAALLNIHLQNVGLPPTAVTIPDYFTKDSDELKFEPEMIQEEDRQNLNQLQYGITDDKPVFDSTPEQLQRSISDVSERLSTISSSPGVTDEMVSIVTSGPFNAAKMLIEEADAKDNEEAVSLITPVLKSSTSKDDDFKTFIDSNPVKNESPGDIAMTEIPKTVLPIVAPSTKRQIPNLGDLTQNQRDALSQDVLSSSRKVPSVKATTDDSPDSQQDVQSDIESSAKPKIETSKSDVSDSSSAPATTSSSGKVKSRISAAFTSAANFFKRNKTNPPVGASDEDATEMQTLSPSKDVKDITSEAETTGDGSNPPPTFDDLPEIKDPTSAKGRNPSRAEVLAYLKKEFNDDSVAANKKFPKCSPDECMKFFDKIKEAGIPATKNLLDMDAQNEKEGKPRRYSQPPTTMQSQISIDTRVRQLGGVIDPVTTDPSQMGLVMSIQQLAYVYANYTKDKWFENMTGNQERSCLRCLYNAFIELCHARNINTSYDQCPVDEKWKFGDPDNCTAAAKKKADENVALAMEKDRILRQNMDTDAINESNDKKRSEAQKAHDAVEGKPPTAQDVYEFINHASSGDITLATAAPGHQHPDTIPKLATEVDNTPDIDHNLGNQNIGKPDSPRPFIRSKLGGGNPSDSDSNKNKVFTNCPPAKCKGFYEKIKKEGIASVSTVVEASEIKKLGGIIDPDEENTHSSQKGLIMCIPQLEDAYKRFTKDKWYEGMMGNQEKRCLLCLYRAFRMICQLRNIKLDATLQGEIPDNYKVDRPVPKQETTSDDESEDESIASSELGSDISDDTPVAAGVTDKKKRPKALKAIASVKGNTGTNPPIEILTDNRNKDKYIWIKISAAPDCLKGVIDNTYDSAEETMKALIDADSVPLPGSSNTPSAPVAVPVATTAN